MKDVTDDPPMATDETAQRDDFAPANTLGKETVAQRRASNSNSPTTSTKETMQATVEQARQIQQSLDNKIGRAHV